VYFIQQVDYTTNFHEIHAKCRARQTPRVGGRPRAVGRGLHVDTACTIVVSERRYLLSPVRLSVCLSSICLSSITFVRPTQAVQIFGNISTVLGTLAIR